MISLQVFHILERDLETKKKQRSNERKNETQKSTNLPKKMPKLKHRPQESKMHTENSQKLIKWVSILINKN